MTFRRTSLGLKNQPIFFESDIVVYIEGASESHLNEEDFDDGEVVTQDGLFWQGVLKAVLPSNKFHFKALGSKSALLEFSSGLDEKVRGSLLICVDRDFEDVVPVTVAMNFVVSTYRYSWEADVWAWVVFLSVFESFLPTGRAPGPIAKKARLSRDKFFSEIVRFVRLDVQTALCNGVGCFLPRSNPSAIVANRKAGFPEVNKAYLRVRLREYRSQLTRPWRPGVPASFSSKRHLFGKAIDRFHCQLTAASMKASGLAGNIPFFLIQNSAIRFLPDALLKGSRARQFDHYRQAVVAAL